MDARAGRLKALWGKASQSVHVRGCDSHLPRRYCPRRRRKARLLEMVCGLPRYGIRMVISWISEPYGRGGRDRLFGLKFDGMRPNQQSLAVGQR